MCTTIPSMRNRQKSCDLAAALRASDEQAMFNRQLAIYRQIVGANLMFHREVYTLLRTLLRDQIQRPFSFLDIACGDASASAAAFRYSSIARYYGIDLSSASLEIAKEELRMRSARSAHPTGDGGTLRAEDSRSFFMQGSLHDQPYLRCLTRISSA